MRENFPPVLAECRDAEDYFRVLGVEYDERVLAVGRLHILKLFGCELAGFNPTGEDVDLVACRAALERAYAALLEAGPLQHRVFKVLADRAPGQFVPDADLLIEDAVPAVARVGGEPA
jgi:nitrogenase-stabilizing/protective protein